MTVERLTIQQLATKSLCHARILERYGIDYCERAPKWLSEVCAARDLNLATLTRELDHARDDIADDRDWTDQPLSELMQYLRNEHEWVRAELRVLNNRLSLVAGVHAAWYAGLQHLPRVFAALGDDLETHMHHEETEVFVAIARYMDAAEKELPLKGSPLSAFGGPLRMTELEHESTGAALRLIRSFSHDYSIPPDACPRYEMLLRGLGALEDRLLQHMYLENNILFARAARLRPGKMGVPQ